MKNVLNTSQEVSHLFASKSHTSARCRNTFIRDTMYFSYGEHYCVARHLKNDYVALNLKQSSPTTEGHKREVLSACSHLKVIKVFDPMRGPDRASTEHHIDRLTEEAARARPDGRRPLIVAKMRRVIEDYNKYCQLTGQSTLILTLPDLSEDEIAKIKAAQKEQAKADKARNAKRNAELAEQHSRRIQEWLQGVGHSLHYDHGETLLRLVDSSDFGEGRDVQTSRGACIPDEDAKRLWPVILRTKDGARDYEVGMQLGSHRLTKINRDGSIVVGCHNIGFDQIEKIAGQLGLLDEVAA